MWRLLFMLALWGVPTLWAGACDGLPAGPPDSSQFWLGPKDDPRPLSFRLSVKKGGPAFRITVRSRLRNLSDNLVAAGEVEVARCQDGKQLQVLPIVADQPMNFGYTFHAGDINFDGYLDFSVVCEFAASGGRRSYWVYDPASQLFARNELTHVSMANYQLG
jgi:hypothetical protein